MSFLSKLLGDPNEKEVKRIRPTIERINALEPEYEHLADAELRAKTDAFRALLVEHEDDLDAQKRILDDILPEAFAMVREAAKRTIGQRH
jgi:preprotein translocase subunit SecA